MNGRRLRSIAYLLIFALLYGGAALAYTFSGRTESRGVLPAVADGVNVQVNAVAVDSVGKKVTMRIRLQPSGSWASDSEIFSFNRPVRLLVFAQATGSQKYDFAAGQPIGGIDAPIEVNGDPADYPLDHYEYEVNDVPVPLLAVYELDAKGNKAGAVPLGMGGQPEGLVNWRESWTFSDRVKTKIDDVDLDIPPGHGVLMVDLDMARAGLTLAFAFVVFGLMLAMMWLAISVAMAVAYRKRRIEATMASWLGAMLFALVPLRAFLPGAPPLGAWMDVLVFFWVELGLLAAMVIFIGSWLKYGPRPEVRPGDESPPPPVQGAGAP